MGYQKTNGSVTRSRMVDFNAVPPYESREATITAATKVMTATTNGPAFELGDADQLRIAVAVTAVSGTTPSMAVTFQNSVDGVTWTTLAVTFSAFTTVSAQRFIAVGCDRFVRPVFTITGTTPSFTVTCVAEAI